MDACSGASESRSCVSLNFHRMACLDKGLLVSAVSVEKSQVSSLKTESAETGDCSLGLNCGVTACRGASMVRRILGALHCVGRRQLRVLPGSQLRLFDDLRWECRKDRLIDRSYGGAVERLPDFVRHLFFLGEKSVSILNSRGQVLSEDPAVLAKKTGVKTAADSPFYFS